MNKRILTYIVLIIIVLIIIVPYFSKEETEIPGKSSINETKKRIISTSNCDKLSEGEEKWECYTAIAEEERAIEVCEKISNLLFKEDCYYIVAFVRNNISMCNQITYDIQRGFCVKNFDDWKNADCSSLEGYDILESNCLKQVGIMNNNLTICQQIKVQSYKDSCIKHVSLNLG